jgi:transcription initiation factor TFIIIB Brf1 subunit/transcription initiation factor TFIIB
MERLFSALKEQPADPVKEIQKEDDYSALKHAWFDEPAEECATLHCPYCNSEDIEQEELSVCKACGEVLERPLDTGAEFRFFGADDRSSIDPCRIGAPTDTRFPSSTLGTMILARAQGGNASNRIAMARVRRYHTWNLLPYRERALLQVFEQLSLAATNHGLDGRTIDLAKDLYIRLVEHCDRRGISRTSVVASCIYSSLKIVGQPRKPKEIADIFHLSSTQFTKSFKYFQEVLSMANQRGLLGDKNIPASLSSTRASDYIAHPLSKLPVSRAAFLQIKEAATKIAEVAEEKELCPENMPPSLAAGVIALVLPRHGHPEITNERIASVCGVSEGTLVKCLRKLEAALDSLKEFLPIQ